jgi:tetratricopeptide (TPR) repeat protein
MRDPIAIAPAVSGVTPETLADQDAALTWFTTEHTVLLATIERAAGTGFDAHTWQLAWAFTTYLLRQGHWSEHITTQHTALAAAHRLGHRAAQADILHGLARSYLRLVAIDDASTHFQRALDVCADLGDPVGQAHNHMGLAEVAERQNRPADALRHNEHALELFRTAGDRVGEANTLNGIGWCYLLLDNYPQALIFCTQGLDLLVELDDQDGQAATWDSLGCIHRGLADYEQAVACHQRSVDMCRGIGDRYWEADALTSLGDTLHVAGDAGSARKAWQDALTILDELDHQKAEQLRAKLPDGASPPPQSADVGRVGKA